MDSSTRNAERLTRLLRACETGTDARFPPTEVFNEGWMLRLVLDAIETHRIADHPLAFELGAKWYSEARLGSPFRPRRRGDPLGEGFTNADGVVGHFDFQPTTRAGLSLQPDATQFIVVEAKMFSNLSSGTRNAPMFNQAARNVACVAKIIEATGRPVTSFTSLGFFVLAPRPDQRGAGISNLEACMDPHAIALAVRERVRAYEGRSEALELRSWEERVFLPLLDWLTQRQRLRVLSWDTCIDAIAAAQPEAGADLRNFYARCLTFRPLSAEGILEEASTP